MNYLYPLSNQDANEYFDEALRNLSDNPQTIAKTLIALNFFLHITNSLRAAQNLRANAAYEAAKLLLFNFGEHDQAIQHLKIAAANGHAHARRDLFTFFRDGSYVAKDPAQAIAYLKMLATSPDADPIDLGNYGVALWNGFGLPKRDAINAVRFMLLAAQNNVSTAYLYIGWWSLFGVENTEIDVDLDRVSTPAEN